MKKIHIFLSTCEFSGDLHGAALLLALQKAAANLNLHFSGIGGTKMQSAGMRLLANPTKISTIGFVEVVRNLHRMKQIFDLILKDWELQKPDLLIWLDSPGFNLPLAKEAQKRGIPVVCMFSPSAWGYGEKRAWLLAQRVRHLLAVLPFEADFYQQFGTKVTYIGHPLIDRVINEESPNAYRQKLNLKPAEKLVALMPGSRRQEIKRLLPVMLQAAQTISQKQQIRWVLPVAASLEQKWLKELIATQAPEIKVTLLTEKAYNLLAAADAAVIASGTATLEAAILGTPMVIIYQVSAFSALIYRLLVNRKMQQKPLMIGLPNLIAGEFVVPELVQKDLSAANIVAKLTPLLTEVDLNQETRVKLQKIKELIGPPGVMERGAAQILKEVVQS